MGSAGVNKYDVGSTRKKGRGFGRVRGKGDKGLEIGNVVEELTWSRQTGRKEGRCWNVRWLLLYKVDKEKELLVLVAGTGAGAVSLGAEMTKAGHRPYS